MDIFFFSNCPPRLRENILRRSKPKCEERGEEPGAQDFEKVYSKRCLGLARVRKNIVLLLWWTLDYISNNQDELSIGVLVECIQI